jgi:hypothetical protein
VRRRGVRAWRRRRVADAHYLLHRRRPGVAASLCGCSLLSSCWLRLLRCTPPALRAWQRRCLRGAA